MPNDNQTPFEDQDLTLSIIQKTVALIMQEVLSIDDIMNDTKKARMFESVALFLNQAGIAMTEVFPAEIANAYATGHELGSDLLSEAGFQEVQGNLTGQVHAAAVQEVAIQGVTDMQAALRTAAAMFITDIGGILEAIQTEIGAGILQGATTRTITQRVQAEFLRNGMTAFITSDNRRLPLDFYAMTVTRTKVRQAHTQGAANRYQENGVDLVRFPIRSHTCKICGARERLVISLRGETEGYPTAAEIGGLPPFHPNCRHYPIPVIDASEYPPQAFTGRDMRTAASKETYGNEQAIRRKANEEKKLYMKMKAEADAAGESFPSIGTWRRMRRKNDQKWKDLQQKYKDSVSSLPSPRQTVRPSRGNTDIIEAAQTQIRSIREATQRPQAAARQRGVNIIEDLPTNMRDMPTIRPRRPASDFADIEEQLAYRALRRADQDAFDRWSARQIEEFKEKERFFETKEQAEVYIKQNMLHESGKVNIDGVDLQLVSAYCRMFDRVAQDFPSLRNSYRYFDNDQGERGDSWIMEATGGIHFGEHKIKGLFNNAIGHIESRYITGDSIYNLFLHEIGHHVQTTLSGPILTEEQIGRNEFDRKLATWWIDVFYENSGLDRHIFSMQKKSRSNDLSIVEQGEKEAKDFLSEYSAYNTYEMFAEMFSAAYTHSADDKPIVGTFRKWLSDVFEADKEGKNVIIKDTAENMSRMFDLADEREGIDIWYDTE
jgi:hypothetical protein